MKSLILFAFLFGAVVQIVVAQDAVEEAAEAVAEAAEAVADAVVAAVKPVANPAAPVVGAVADAGKAFADVAQAAVDDAGAVIPGAVLPAKFAGGVLDMIKERIDSVKTILDAEKVAFPFFNPFAGHGIFKRSAEDLDFSCIPGFNEAQEELFYIMMNNQCVEFCNSPEGQTDKGCMQLFDPLSVTYEKTHEVVNMISDYCKSLA